MLTIFIIILIFFVIPKLSKEEHKNVNPKPANWKLDWDEYYKDVNDPNLSYDEILERRCNGYYYRLFDDGEK